MQKDFSWHQSARHYIDLYERAIADSSEDPTEQLRSVGNG
jgi:glycogen synthase